MDFLFLFYTSYVHLKGDTMNKSVTKFIKTVKRGFGKRSPEILLGIGIASGITTTILAVKATPKALVVL